jgi:hypothetical protein
MRFNTRIMRIETAPPGWNNVFLFNAEPWYALRPIAVWSEVAVAPSSGDDSGPARHDTYVMGLSQTGIAEIGTPIAPLSCVGCSGYWGMVHDEEVTPAVKHAWQVEAYTTATGSNSPWRHLCCVDDDGEAEPRMPDQVRGLSDLLLTVNFLPKCKYVAPRGADTIREAKTWVGIILARAKALFLPSEKLKVLQRVPASPGWHNVYLTNREPWFHLRAIAFWMLVRKIRSPFVPRSVIGLDAGINFPAANDGQGFVQMIHKSEITPAMTERWTSAAKKAIIPYPTGQEK